MGKTKYVKKTMPYTKAALEAAERWATEVMAFEGWGEDHEAMVESLAEAFTDYALEHAREKDT